MVDEIKIGKGQLSIEKGVAPKSAFPVAVLSLGVYIYIFGGFMTRGLVKGIGSNINLNSGLKEANDLDSDS